MAPASPYLVALAGSRMAKRHEERLGKDTQILSQRVAASIFEVERELAWQDVSDVDRLRIGLREDLFLIEKRQL